MNKQNIREKIDKKIKKIIEKRCKGKCVEIGFENVDVMEIPYDKIKLLFAKDIKSDTSLRDRGERFDMKCCNVFFMIIDGEWTKGKHYEFKIKEYEKEIYDRLKGCDICSFNYKEKGKKQEPIYVPWSEEDEYTNMYQKIGKCENGDIWISICDKNTEKKLKEVKKSWQCKN